MAKSVYLYGKNPLKEALLSQKRTGVAHIEQLYLTKRESENPEIISLVQTHKIDYSIVTAQEIESYVGRDTIHQGICALLNEKSLYSSLDTVLATNASSNRLIIILDELQDPHNVGAIIRSAVSFGASAVLIPDHGQVELNATVIKSASGMSFAIPIIKIGNVNTTLEKLKKERFWVYGLTGDGETALQQTTFDADTVIVVGSEGRGIHKITKELCDFRLSINTSNLSESLNASNAVAVTLYEWHKQNTLIK